MMTLVQYDAEDALMHLADNAYLRWKRAVEEAAAARMAKPTATKAAMIATAECNALCEGVAAVRMQKVADKDASGERVVPNDDIVYASKVREEIATKHGYPNTPGFEPVHSTAR